MRWPLADALAARGCAARYRGASGGDPAGSPRLAR